MARSRKPKRKASRKKSRAPKKSSKRCPPGCVKRKLSRKASRKRKSAKRKSRKRKSAKRKSRKRKSAKRKSRKRKSAKRKSRKRKSAKRKSRKRKPKFRLSNRRKLRDDHTSNSRCRKIIKSQIHKMIKDEEKLYHLQKKLKCGEKVKGSNDPWTIPLTYERLYALMEHTHPLKKQSSRVSKAGSTRQSRPPSRSWGTAGSSPRSSRSWGTAGSSPRRSLWDDMNRASTSSSRGSFKTPRRKSPPTVDRALDAYAREEKRSDDDFSERSSSKTSGLTKSNLALFDQLVSRRESGGDLGVESAPTEILGSPTTVGDAPVRAQSVN